MQLLSARTTNFLLHLKIYLMVRTDRSSIEELKCSSQLCLIFKFCFAKIVKERNIHSSVYGSLDTDCSGDEGAFDFTVFSYLHTNETSGEWIVVSC